MQVLDREASSGSPPEWLSTHPLPKTRIQRVSQELSTTYGFTQSGDRAKNYQEFADRYRQRYLSIRSVEPNPPGTKKKTEGGAPIDGRGRTRLLAAVTLDDPSSWCAVCAARAAEAGAAR